MNRGGIKEGKGRKRSGERWIARKKTEFRRDHGAIRWMSSINLLHPLLHKLN